MYRLEVYPTVDSCGSDKEVVFFPGRKMHDAAFVAKDATLLPVTNSPWISREDQQYIEGNASLTFGAIDYEVESTLPIRIAPVKLSFAESKKRIAVRCKMQSLYSICNQ